MTENVVAVRAIEGGFVDDLLEAYMSPDYAPASWWDTFVPAILSRLSTIVEVDLNGIRRALNDRLDRFVP